MGQDDNTVFRHMYVCLERVGAYFNRAFEGSHGVLRKLRLVPSMGNGLGSSVSRHIFPRIRK